MQDVRYWLQINDEGYRPDRPTPELGTEPDSVLSHEEVTRFALETAVLVDRFFAGLDDRRLKDPSPVNHDLTLVDAILHQIRHVTYHVGHCDSILREQRMATARWRGFGE